MLACIRPHIDKPVGAAQRIQVVLDDEQGVAGRLELAQHRVQGFRIGGMQPCRRLVQHVDHAEQIGARLRRQAQPL